MRCPICHEGILLKSRAKMKNGETITVISCNEQEHAWAEEVCREKWIDFNDIADDDPNEEPFTEVDSDNSRENILSFALYDGWDTKETCDVDCPYCRTVKLCRGITTQTKREIYECAKCSTVWIGSICPENVSNYRKYKADGIRVPDETEIDLNGEKSPAVFEKEQDTEYICPKCGDGILYGAIHGD